MSIEEAMLESQRSDTKYEHGNSANYQSLHQENLKLKKEIKSILDQKSVSNPQENKD